MNKIREEFESLAIERFGKDNINLNVFGFEHDSDSKIDSDDIYREYSTENMYYFYKIGLKNKPKKSNNRGHNSDMWSKEKWIAFYNAVKPFLESDK